MSSVSTSLGTAKSDVTSTRIEVSSAQPAAKAARRRSGARLAVYPSPDARETNGLLTRLARAADRL
jgi:hypothetical protein